MSLDNNLLRGVIIKGVGGLYTVSTERGTYTCTVRGIFRNKKITPLIGDSVSIRIGDEEKKEASIEEIHPRRNEMRRPRVANVDTAVIVQAASSPDFNSHMLDRMLILTENESLDIVICINKYDLDPDGHSDAVAEIYRGIGYPVVLVSAVDHSGIGELRPYLAEKVTVFAGPSGVGKSSIINAIAPDAGQETGDLSRKIERGKHTTRHASLIQAFSGGYVVDTPGFTSLSFDHIDSAELPFLFRDFRPFLGGCRFNDCRHAKETDCLIKENVGSSIPKSRYESYVELLDETATGFKK